eukprot:Clim_evm36s2 gene=Clim_evmTU36s2
MSDDIGISMPIDDIDVTIERFIAEVAEESLQGEESQLGDSFSNLQSYLGTLGGDTSTQQRTLFRERSPQEPRTMSPLSEEDDLDRRLRNLVMDLDYESPQTDQREISQERIASELTPRQDFKFSKAAAKESVSPTPAVASAEPSTSQQRVGLTPYAGEIDVTPRRPEAEAHRRAVVANWLAKDKLILDHSDKQPMRTVVDTIQRMFTNLNNMNDTHHTGDSEFLHENVSYRDPSLVGDRISQVRNLVQKGNAARWEQESMSTDLDNPYNEHGNPVMLPHEHRRRMQLRATSRYIVQGKQREAKAAYFKHWIHRTMLQMVDRRRKGRVLTTTWHRWKQQMNDVALVRQYQTNAKVYQRWRVDVLRQTWKRWLKTHADKTAGVLLLDSYLQFAHRFRAYVLTARAWQAWKLKARNRAYLLRTMLVQQSQKSIYQPNMSRHANLL